LPMFSPDGTTILFDGPGSGAAELWVVNADGTNPHPIISTTGTEVTRTGLTIQWSTNGAYSPDGTKIVYASTQSGRSEIWVMSADGSGQTQLTFPDNANAPDANDPSWSPDGSKIVFWSGFAREYGNIYTMDADGSGRTQLTFEPDGQNSDNPAWSPDGKSIMFESSRGGTIETWLMNADGTDSQVLFSGSYGGGRLPIARIEASAISGAPGDAIIDGYDGSGPGQSFDSAGDGATASFFNALIQGAPADLLWPSVDFGGGVDGQAVSYTFTFDDVSDQSTGIEPAIADILDTTSSAAQSFDALTETYLWMQLTSSPGDCQS
jgi:WD40 repeat protein